MAARVVMITSSIRSAGGLLWHEHFQGKVVCIECIKWNERPLPMDAAQEAEAKKARVDCRKEKGHCSPEKETGQNQLRPPVPVASLPGTVVDDLHAKLNGAWTVDLKKAFVGNYITMGRRQR